MPKSFRIGEAKNCHYKVCKKFPADPILSNEQIFIM
jgi:hypothetical protein